MKKVLLVLLSSVLLFLSLPITSYAYPSEFDPEYYDSHNPDVVDVYGNDPESLYNHYKEYGFIEGRYKNATEEATGVITNIVTIIPGYSTYIDVNLDLQLVTYFQDGQIVFQSQCVSGCVKTKHETPKGNFKIITKVPGKRLKGPTWNCWVNRWMQFTTSACGFHDANWRSSFGNTIYKNDGSHGCINLPTQAAYDLYDLVSVGTIVIVH